LFLSVCIITKNEASNIQTCLDSVQQIADEIIIVDAFSADTTVEIAKNYTSKIYSKKWVDDFSLARNFSISKAKGDWILIIDADEELVYDDEFISNLKTTKTNTFSVIRKERYRQAHDSKLVQYPVTIIRLFKRTTEAQFQYPIHERLDDYFQSAQIEVGIQQYCYLNHHISPNTTLVDAKQEKYLQHIDRYLAKHPEDEWMLYQKIKTLQYFSRHNEILQITQNFHPKSLKIKVAIACILSQIYTAQKQPEKAIHILQSLKNAARFTIVNMLLGDIYFSQKKYFSALKKYLRLQTNRKSIDFENAPYISVYCEKEDKVYKIASVLYSMNAHALCLLYLDAHKKHLQADSLLLYAFIFLKKGNTQRALEYIRKARQKDPEWKKLIELENLYQ